MKIAISTSSWARKLFLLLLLTDLCFLVLHVFFLMGQWNDPYLSLYSIEKDRGFAEFFQYTKEYWCVLLLSFFIVKKRSPLYLCWMLLFLYLLLDDFASIHEKLGLSLSRSLGLVPIFGLRARDFGELIVSASVGLFFVSYIGIAYRLGNRVFRKVSRYLITMLLLLAAFGIAIDLVHIVVPDSLSNAFGFLEDGGEMIVMSAIVTFIFTLCEDLFEKK